MARSSRRNLRKKNRATQPIVILFIRVYMLHMGNLEEAPRLGERSHAVRAHS